MRRVYADTRLLYLMNRRRKIVRIIKRNAVDAAHRRTDNLRVVQIDCIPAHDNPGNACALTGSQHRTEVAGVLYIFQKQKQRCFVPQHFFYIIVKLFQHA